MTLLHNQLRQKLTRLSRQEELQDLSITTDEASRTKYRTFLLVKFIIDQAAIQRETHPEECINNQLGKFPSFYHKPQNPTWWIWLRLFMSSGKNNDYKTLPGKNFDSQFFPPISDSRIQFYIAAATTCPGSWRSWVADYSSEILKMDSTSDETRDAPYTKYINLACQFSSLIESCCYWSGDYPRGSSEQSSWKVHSFFYTPNSYMMSFDFYELCKEQWS